MKARGCFITLILMTLVTVAFAGLVPAAQGADSYLECWSCHRLPNLQTALGVYTANQLCWQCHDGKAFRQAGNATVSLNISQPGFKSTSHGSLPCIDCHAEVARNPHRVREPVQCQSCHRQSAARMVVAEHSRVSCTACHLTDRPAVKTRLGMVTLSPDRLKPALSHRITDNVECRRCHNRQGQAAAPPVAVPKKSIFCAGCHPSHITLGPPAWAYSALIIFLFGICANIAFWLKGSIPGRSQRWTAKLGYLMVGLALAFRPERWRKLAKSLLINGMWHQRLFAENLGRWLGHMMIFGSIVFRFSLSAYVFLAAAYYPLTDPNHRLISLDTPWVAAAYDASGALIAIGIVFAWIRRIMANRKQKNRSSGPDWTLLLMLEIIVVLGFAIEAMQMAIFGATPDSGFAFAGFALSAAIPIDLALKSYIYGWTLHALGVYILIAYIPFSKAWHAFVSPLIVMLNAEKE